MGPPRGLGLDPTLRLWWVRPEDLPAPELTQATHISELSCSVPARTPTQPPPGSSLASILLRQPVPRQPQGAVKRRNVDRITLLLSPTMAPRYPPRKTQAPPEPTRLALPHPSHRVSRTHTFKTPPGALARLPLCAECRLPPVSLILYVSAEARQRSPVVHRITRSLPVGGRAS